MIALLQVETGGDAEFFSFFLYHFLPVFLFLPSNMEECWAKQIQSPSVVTHPAEPRLYHTAQKHGWVAEIQFSSVIMFIWACAWDVTEHRHIIWNEQIMCSKPKWTGHMLFVIIILFFCVVPEVCVGAGNISDITLAEQRKTTCTKVWVKSKTTF